jgi:hypothetical protein
MAFVFRVYAPCGLVEVYRRFRDACCFRRQYDFHDVAAANQNIAIFMLAAVGT